MAEGSAGAEFDVQSEVDRAGVGVIWLEWGGLLQPDDWNFGVGQGIQLFDSGGGGILAGRAAFEQDARRWDEGLVQPDSNNLPDWLFEPVSVEGCRHSDGRLVKQEGGQRYWADADA